MGGGSVLTITARSPSTQSRCSRSACRYVARWLGLLPVAAVVVVAVVAPVVGFLRVAVERAGGGGEFLADVVAAAATPAVRDAVADSFRQTLASTVGCLVLGVPLGWIVGRWPDNGSRRRAMLDAALAVPFVMPVFVVALAVTTLARAVSGPVNSGRHAFVLVVVANVVFNAGVVARIVAPAAAALPSQMSDAARLAGAGAGGRWRRVLLPLLAPSVASAAAVVAMLCWGSFGVVRLVGDGRVRSVETELWTAVTRRGDLAAATLLATLFAFAASTGAIAWWVVRGSTSRRRGGGAIETRPFLAGVTTGADGAGGRWWGAKGSSRFAVLAIAVLAAWPAVALVRLVATVGSPANWTLTVRPGTSAAVPLLDAALNSALLAVVVAVVSILVGVWPALGVSVGSVGVGGPPAASRWMVGAVVVAAAMSPVLVGAGFVVAEPLAWLGMSAAVTEWIAIAAVQTSAALPYVMAMLVPAFAAVGRRRVEAAATLGVSPTAASLRVVLAGSTRALASAAAMSAAISLGEFGATVTVSTGRVPTLATAVDRLLSLPLTEVRGAAAVIGLAVVAVAACASWLAAVAGPLGRPESNTSMRPGTESATP